MGEKSCENCRFECGEIEEDWVDDNNPDPRLPDDYCIDYDKWQPSGSAKMVTKRR